MSGMARNVPKELESLDLTLRRPHPYANTILHHINACLESQFLFDEEHSVLLVRIELLKDLKQLETPSWLGSMIFATTLGMSTILSIAAYCPNVPCITLLSNSAGNLLAKLQYNSHMPNIENLIRAIKDHCILHDDITIYFEDERTVLRSITQKVDFLRSMVNTAVDLLSVIVKQVDGLVKLLAEYNIEWQYNTSVIILDNYRIPEEVTSFSQIFAIFKHFKPYFVIITSSTLYLTSLSLFYHIKFKNKKLLTEVFEVTPVILTAFEEKLIQCRKEYHDLKYVIYEDPDIPTFDCSIIQNYVKPLDQIIKQEEYIHMITLALRERIMPPHPITDVEAQFMITDIVNMMSDCIETFELIRMVPQALKERPKKQKRHKTKLKPTREMIYTIRCTDRDKPLSDETFEGVSENPNPDFDPSANREADLPGDSDNVKRVREMVSKELKAKLKKNRKKRRPSPIMSTDPNIPFIKYPSRKTRLKANRANEKIKRAEEVAKKEMEEAEKVKRQEEKSKKSAAGKKGLVLPEAPTTSEIQPPPPPPPRPSSVQGNGQGDEEDRCISFLEKISVAAKRRHQIEDVFEDIFEDASEDIISE